MMMLRCILLILVMTQDVMAQVNSLHEDFTVCSGSLPNGWMQYSVVGGQNWQCHSSGYSGACISMNGYAGGAQVNEDWLISPLVDISTYFNPVLSFWCRNKYSGPFLEVLISQNYSGSGNPNTATWQSLPVVLPTANSDTWFLSDLSSLQAYKSQAFHLAFRYTSTNSEAAWWRLDGIHIHDGSLSVSESFIHCGDMAVGQASDGKIFQFTMTGPLTTLSLEAPPPFELSTDGVSYTSTLHYGAGISGITQTAYVRVKPQQARKVFRNQLQFLLNGNPLSAQLFLMGTSLPANQTLSACTWNMRWFGDPSACNCDTNQSRLHAGSILKNLHADIYCVQEIVNTQSVALLSQALGPQYAYTISSFCSFAASPADPDYASGQKLAMIYNTDKIELLQDFGLLASTYPSDTSANSAYYCFASGRFPHVMKVSIKLRDGLRDTLILVNVHAKANADMPSYLRRQYGAEKMTDSLNTLFPGRKILVLGDYNDLLEGSTVSGTLNSPYTYLLNQGFTGLTLPSLFPGQTSFTGSQSLIDNMSCSDSLLPRYIDSSCFIFQEATSYIPFYSSSTSDHIPVMGYFDFTFPLTLSVQDREATSDFVLINPSGNTLHIRSTEPLKHDFSWLLYDIQGRVLSRGFLKTGESYWQLPQDGLAAGSYYVRLFTKHQQNLLSWTVLP